MIQHYQHVNYHHGIAKLAMGRLYGRLYSYQ